MIKIIITDIDGVLTDGKGYINSQGEITKTISFHDLDTVSQIKNSGLDFAIITGESDLFTRHVKNVFRPRYFVEGCKEKVSEIKKIAEKEKISLSEICYIGDGKYDVDALALVGLGVCPADAIIEAKNGANHVLKQMAGEGCLKATYDYVCDYNKRCCATKEYTEISDSEITNRLVQHLRVIDDIIASREIMSTVKDISKKIVYCLKNGGRILLCGNGGSAADAQHLAAEFVSKFYIEREAFCAEALSVNTSVLTAIGNDYDYSKVFERQVEANGKSGDILIGITTSGNSKNVINAMSVAKKIGLETISFTGNRAEKLKTVSDIILNIPSDDTPRIQEGHIVLGHIICELVENEMVEKN